MAQTIVTIPSANTNTVSNRWPYGCFYGYERTDMIYWASEIGTTGQITSIGFYVNSVSSPAASTPVVIRMQTTTATAVNTTATYSAISASSTIVWSGNITSSMLTANNWVTVTLTTPFIYSGGNLEVLVEASYGGTGGEGSTAKQFRWSAPSPTGTLCQYWYQDNSAPTGTSTSTSTRRPNVQFSITPLSPCSGTPTAGTASAPVTNICSNTPFTLTLTGATIGGGITYQWQSSPAGLNTWTNISGATSTSYTVSNQTVATDYCCVVTCTNSGGGSATSNVVAVGQNTPSQCYCTPTGGSSSTSYYINNISVTGALATTGFPYTASSYSAYQDKYSTSSCTQIPGGSVTISMSVNTSTSYFIAWVDWNQNGSFNDPGEQVFIQNSYTANVSFSFSVPTGQASGDYRMRFAQTDISPNPGSCGPAPYGNFVDAKLTVGVPAPCADVPASVDVTPVGSIAACTNSTVQLTAAVPSALIGGYTYQWYQNGTPISGATSPAYTYVASATASFYAVVGCPASPGSTTTSNTVNVNVSGVCPSCIPTGGSSSTSYYINNISVTGALATTGFPYTASSYSAYQDKYSTSSCTQIQGGSVTISMSVNTSTSYFIAWVDWNQNGSFNDPGEQVFVQNGYVASVTFPINIGVNQSPGDYRMRFAQTDISPNPGSCGPAPYGNFVDARLTVGVPAPCAGAPASASVTPVGAVSACTNSLVQLTAAAPSALIGGYTYQWYQNGTPISGAISPTYTYVASATASFYAVLGCPASPGSTVTSNTVNVNVSGVCPSPCTPTGGSSSTSYYINNISVTGALATTGFPYTASSYSAYQDRYSTSSCTQIPGGSVTISMSVNTSTSYFIAWVDWNQNGSFNDPGEQVFIQNSYVSSVTFPIGIGANQLPGDYRMRFAQTDISPNPGSCGPAPYGNFVDAKLRVLPLAPVINSFTPSSGCANTATVTISGSYFTNVTAVTVGGTSVDTFTIVSDNVITATIGSGTTGVITLATTTDTTASTGVFTVNSPTSEMLYDTACVSFTWHGTMFASSGIYYDTLTNAAGCDSVITLNLTIHNSSTGIDTVTACDSFTWINGVTYYVDNISDTVIRTNAAGCDSVVTLNLTIHNSSTGIDTVSACDSFTWIDGNTYTQSNSTATYTLQNAAGCDSLVTLDLTIKHSTFDTVTISACDSFTWSLNGVTYIQSNNTDTVHLTNAAGCDSVITLNLTIHNSSTGIDTVTACNSFTWINGVTYYADNTSDTVIRTNAAGCDSVVTLNLTIHNSSTGIDTVSACDSFTWIDGNTYTQSNSTATYTLQNAAGCDSIVTLDLTLKHSTFSSETQTVCGSYSFGGTVLTASGTYYDTLANASGCDSIVSLNLTINSLPVVTAEAQNVSCYGGADGSVVLQQGNPISTYVWTPSGQNAATASGLTAGNYVVTVTDVNGCSASVSVTVGQPQQIQVAVLSENAKCFGEQNGSVLATATGGFSPYHYSIISGESNSSGAFSNLEVGTYTVSVVDANNCTVSLPQITISQPDSIVLHLAPSDSVIMQMGNTVMVSVSSNFPNAVYTWSPAVGLSCTDCSTNAITLLRNQIYTITATINGCSATVRLPVSVKQDYEMYVPNVFTPNGDGTNDDWEVFFANKSAVKMVQIEIFDRWGEMVFASNDLNFKWDGRFKGELLSPGIYTYTLTVVFADNYSVNNQKGVITLLR